MSLAEFLGGSVWGTMVRAPFRLIPRGSVVPILSGPLRGKRWVVGAQRHACWLGIYEADLQALIAQRLRPGCVFYDIGANAGFHTLLAAAYLQEGHVYAFEPVPSNVSLLRAHVEINSLANVTVYPVAVSESSGESRFDLGPTCAEGRLSSQGTLTVTTVSLDDIVSKWDIRPPDFIKMDIEGEEFRALKGAKECFARHRPELFLATHGGDVHQACCEILKSWGYSSHITTDSEAERASIHAVPG